MQWKKNGRHPIKKQWKEHKPAGQRSECLGDADPAGNESGEAIKLNKRTKSKATQSSPYVSLYTAHRFPDKCWIINFAPRCVINTRVTQTKKQHKHNIVNAEHVYVNIHICMPNERLTLTGELLHALLSHLLQLFWFMVGSDN